MLYKLQEVSDIYCDACVRDDAGNILFLSLYGRDTALLHLFAAFSLKPQEGGLAGFTLIGKDGLPHAVLVPDVKRLNKHAGRLPKENLFGNLTHTWIYDQRLALPDYANRIAWVIMQIDDIHGQVPQQTILNKAWEVMKELSPIPLLDHWKTAVLDMTAETAIQLLSASTFPPIGSVTGFRLQLNDAFITTISDAVRSKRLKIVDSCNHNQQAGTEESAPVDAAQLSRFPLGKLAMTPGVQEYVESGMVSPLTLLRKHASGNWGVVDSEDWASNDESLKYGSRVLSAYPIDASKPSKGHGDNTIWIITEADRSVTTLLLPHEY